MHRVVFELEKGPIPVGQVVCHSCDNRKCIEPTHLFIATQAENLEDAFRKGRRQRAVRKPIRRKSQDIFANVLDPDFDFL